VCQNFLSSIVFILPRRIGFTKVVNAMNTQSFKWILRSLAVTLLGLFVFGAFAQQASAQVWRDAATGQATPSFPIIQDQRSEDPAANFRVVIPDAADPFRAFDPVSGRNFVRDTCGYWSDTATGQRLPLFPIIQDQRSEVVADNFRVVIPDAVNPSRAFDPVTGRNFVRVPCPCGTTATVAAPPATPPQVGLAPGLRAVGLCEPLPGVATGVHGTAHPKPIRLVIQDSANFANFFGGHPPATPVIDFAKQVVLAVGMGNEPSGGYSIGIDHVQVGTSGFTAGYGYVYVVQQTPIPGVTYSPNPTQPFQVITLPKGASVYNFVDEPTAEGYQQIEMHISNTATHLDSTLLLNSNGSYIFEPAIGTPFRGTATQAEVQAVSDAVIGANLGKLPVIIPDTRTPPGTTVFSLEADVGLKSYFLHSAIDYFGSYGTQVQPLVNSLQAIEARAEGPVRFDSLSYSIGGGLTPYTETVTVDYAGNALVNHAMGVGGTNYTGVATKAQLRALSDSIANLSLSTLPSTITDPNAPKPVLGTEVFRSVTNDGTFVTSVASAGFYGPFNSRLKPLADSFRDVAESVVGATEGTPITGLVVYNPGTTSPPTGPTLAVGANYIDPTDPFFHLLSTLNGKTVTIDAITVGTKTSVVDVQGTVPVANTERAFPSPIGTPVFGLAAGTTVQVSDFSVPGSTFYRLTPIVEPDYPLVACPDATLIETLDGTSDLIKCRGYVPAASVALGTGTLAPVIVPNVVGLTQAAAVSGLTAAHLTLGTVTLASSATVPAGSVISQTPAAGATATAGTAVNLTESSGPASVSVPNVVGLTQAAATTALTGMGLTLGSVTTASSATVPAGSVISQTPSAGTTVAPGSGVNLTVSSGPATVSVPNVVGLTQASATTALTGAGLTLGAVTTASSATVPAGSVISQTPTAGTSVAHGTAVNLTVSTGAASLTVSANPPIVKSGSTVVLSVTVPTGVTSVAVTTSLGGIFPGLPNSFVVTPGLNTIPLATALAAVTANTVVTLNVSSGALGGSTPVTVTP